MALSREEGPGRQAGRPRAFEWEDEAAFYEMAHQRLIFGRDQGHSFTALEVL